MNRTLKLATVLALVIALAGMGTAVAKDPSLYDQLGGKPSVTALATEFLQGAAQDPALLSMIGGKNMEAIVPKFANSLCAALGGGCVQPYTKEELRSAGSKVTAVQGDAIRANWDAAMKKVGVAPELQEKVTKTIGDKLRAIFAVLH